MNVFRKTLSFLLSIMMILTILPAGLTVGAASADTLILEAGQTDGKPGDTVTVPVTISQNPGIVALKVKIFYNPDQLELITQPDCSESQVKFQNSTFSQKLSDHPYVVMFDSSTAGENITLTGALMTLSFRIKENAGAGSSEIKVTAEQALDFSLNDIPCEIVNGSVTVTVPEPPAEECGIFAISSADAHVGEEVQVKLSVKDNPGFTAAELRISYDEEKLELMQAEDTGLIEGYTASDKVTVHPYYVSWQISDHTDANGDLVTFTFKVKDTCSAGTAEISVSENKVWKDFCETEFKTIGGTITVTVPEPPAEECGIFAISSADAHVGEEVQVKLSVKDNPGFTAAELQLSYDTEKLELMQAEDTGLIGGYTASDKVTVHPYYVSWQGNENTEVNGDLAAFTFKVKDTCTAGTSAKISVSVKKILDEDFRKVEFTAEDGAIHILGCEDADGQWESDGTNHWHTCTCGSEFDKNVHTPTTISGSANGSFHSKCKVCTEEYEKAVETDTPVIVVSDAEGEAGETVEVTIRLKNNPGICSAILNISYDEDVLVLPGNDFGTISWTTSSWENTYEDLLITTLKFRILPGIKDGTESNVEITYVPGNLINAVGETVSFAIDNGVITITNPDTGDDRDDKPDTPDTPSKPAKKTTVSFRLNGDKVHGSGKHTSYVPWISRTTYEIKEGDTVYDVFVKALSDHGMSQKGAAGGYVSAVRAPSSKGGYWLSEFDNGPNSGWMYTVNGAQVNDTLTEYVLEDGDSIVWYYTDDYTKPYGESSDTEETPEEDRVDEKDTENKKESEEKQTASPDEPDAPVNTEIPADTEIFFTDVAESDWFYEDVRYAVKKGLFNGTGSGRFSPNAAITRAMLVTVLYRLEGTPAVSGQSKFVDTANDQWYTNAVIWAADHAIVNGYGSGKFGPDDPITREQMAAVLYRYALYKGYDVSASVALSGYGDYMDISVYALKPMRWANAEGLIKGRTADMLVPGGTATRAETAAILHRFIENAGKG